MKRGQKWLSFVVSCVITAACGDNTSDMNAVSDGKIEVGVTQQVPKETLTQLRATAISTLNGFLETVRSDYQVPPELGVEYVACGVENAFYTSKTRRITMCDEMFAQVAGLWFNPALSAEENTERVVGAWSFIFFHELGHGLADVFNLPLTGREEDAVDDFSTLVLLGSSLADEAISAANFWHTKARDPATLTLDDFLDEHSLDEQRFGAIICLVFGSDPEQFGQLAAQAGLSERRRMRCPGEFQQKATAWQQLLEPFERNK